MSGALFVLKKQVYIHYHKATKQASRIDYIFMSSNLLGNVLDDSVNPHGFSDHSIVSLKLHDPNNLHGQGRWICNNSILTDNDCNYRIETFLTFLITQKDNYDLLDWWESGKFRIKKIIKDYGKGKAHHKKQKQIDLQRRYNSLIDNPNSNADIIKDLEIQLKNYEMDEWSKSKVRARNIIKDESEKAYKLFLNLEKQQIQNSKIDKLINSEGKYVNQPYTMLDYANNFYSDLYKAEDISTEHLNDITSKIEKKHIPDNIL